LELSLSENNGDIYSLNIGSGLIKIMSIFLGLILKYINDQLISDNKTI